MFVSGRCDDTFFSVQVIDHGAALRLHFDLPSRSVAHLARSVVSHEGLVHFDEILALRRRGHPLVAYEPSPKSMQSSYLTNYCLKTDHTRHLPSPAVCRFVFESNSWLFYVGTCLAESKDESMSWCRPCLTDVACAVILTLRTWAVWNKDWRLSIALPIFFAACFGVNIPLIVIFVKSLRCKNVQIRDCFVD